MRLPCTVALSVAAALASAATSVPASAHDAAPGPAPTAQSAPPTGQSAQVDGDHDASGEDRSTRLLGLPGGGPDRLPLDWFDGDDVIVTSHGSSSGFQLFLGRQDEAYAFRGLATIQPGGDSTDDWLGYQCLTGDRRFVVAVVLRRGQLNRAESRDRGALAYAVSVADGTVRPLAAGVAFKRHAVGCGTGSRVALLRHLGTDQEASEVIEFDARTGDEVATTDVEGQLTHPVPATPRGVLGIRGRSVLALSDGATKVLATFPGSPQALQPRAAGGADVAVDLGPARRLYRVDARGTTTVGPTAPGIDLRLRAGGNAVFGTRAPGMLDLAPPSRAKVTDVSARGLAYLAIPDRGAEPRVSPLARQLYTSAGERLATEFGSPAQPVTAVPDLPGRRVVGGGGRIPGTAAPAAGSTTPVCAVPRNDPRKQALQPVREQMDWAVQQASRNALSAANGNGRPANYLNMGLAAYGPSTDFPAPALSGGAAGAVVPPSVMNGVLAQENAYRHASRRALPGTGGNPTIGDYYGSLGTLDRIEYNDADCGYGAAQVTDGMRIDQNTYSVNGKTKIAVDYAENIQVGLKILIGKWNQLYAAGITMNTADPQWVENWYTALWAYNSGVQPTAALGNSTGCTPSPTCTDGSGNWGLGWTNNPANPDYPQDRDLFLRRSYADAESPGDWPYQERVLGFAETPILDYKGRPSYSTPVTAADGETKLAIPLPDSFCQLAVNKCDYGWSNPAGPAYDNCTLSDRRCWWHGNVTYTDCASHCHRSAFTYATTAPEPAATNPYPPACQSPFPSGTVVVDDLPEPVPNIVGCSTRNWTSAGTFQYTVGSDSAGTTLGVIDLHQLATGFGGHTYFTGNRLATDSAHRVTGVWTPPALETGPYVVQVHIPRSGASATTAQYQVRIAGGSIVTVGVDQHLHDNRWVSLGAFNLGADASVTLTNVTRDDTAGGIRTVGFDAVAFVPAPVTFVTRDVEAVAIFDRTTDLDANWPNTWIGQPLSSRDAVYAWADGLVSAAGQTPPCTLLNGTDTLNCLRPNTWQAFNRWRAEIIAAGKRTDAPPGVRMIPEWLGFANSAPVTGNAPSAADDGAFKIRSSVRFTYVLANGKIMPGSASAQYSHRTGNTHLPRFVTDLVQAIAADYPQIGMPDLTYSTVDLNVHDHQVRTVRGFDTGQLPGRAYRTAGQQAVVSADGTCVDGLFTAGGSIGYRPMLSEPAASNAMVAWANRAADAHGRNEVPHVVYDVTEQIKDVFFDDKVPPFGTGFSAAPVIWQELNVRACADGTVRASDHWSKPGETGRPLFRQSHMPDGYLFVDGQPATGSGTVSSATVGPVQRGNWRRFTNEQLTRVDEPFGPCGSDLGVNGSNGNPWSMDQLPINPGDNPIGVRHCINSNLTIDDEYSG